MTAFEEVIPDELRVPRIELVKNAGSVGITEVELNPLPSDRQRRLVERVTGDAELDLSVPEISTLGVYAGMVYAMRRPTPTFERQAQVLALVAQGHINRDIIETLRVPGYCIRDDYATALRNLPGIGLAPTVMHDIALAIRAGKDPQELFAPFLVPESEAIRTIREEHNRAASLSSRSEKNSASKASVIKKNRLSLILTARKTAKQAI